MVKLAYPVRRQLLRPFGLSHIVGVGRLKAGRDGASGYGLSTLKALFIAAEGRLTEVFGPGKPMTPGVFATSVSAGWFPGR
jgi:hypothetical protein